MSESFDIAIKDWYRFIFTFKLSFNYFKFIYLNIFSFELLFKFSNLKGLFISDCVDDPFIVLLIVLFDLGEVVLNKLCGTLDVLKKAFIYCLLYLLTQWFFHFRLHWLNGSFYIFLIWYVLWNNFVMKFHNTLDNQLELVCIHFHLSFNDAVILEHSREQFMNGIQRLWQLAFYFRLFCQVINQ